MKNVELQYSPGGGRAEPDGAIEHWFQTLIKPDGGGWDQVGCHLMITRARLGLVRGEIDSLVISYLGEKYECTEYGGMPDEFTRAMQDYDHQWSLEIFKAGLEAMQKGMQSER
jgi:hypothetical protein